MANTSTVGSVLARWLRYSIYLFVATTTLSGAAGILILLGMFLFPILPLMILPFALSFGGRSAAAPSPAAEPAPREAAALALAASGRMT